MIDILTEAEGRLTVDASVALREITGNEFDRVEDWQRWWKSFGKIFAYPAAVF